MKPRILPAILVMALFLLSISFAEEEKQEEKPKPDGKSLFASAKCASCHYISKLQLGKKPVEGKKKAAPDLSTVGSKYTGEFMTKYVKKTETIKGKKHLGSFKGSDAELTVIVDWLLTLKEEPPKE